MGLAWTGLQVTRCSHADHLRFEENVFITSEASFLEFIFSS